MKYVKNMMLLPAKMLLACFFLFYLDSPLFAGEKKDTAYTADPVKTGDSAVISLVKKTEQVSHILNNARSILNKGFDTSDISADLPEIENRLENINEIYQNNLRVLSFRNLSLIKNILNNYKSTLNRWQELLFKYSSSMNEINQELVQINQDSGTFFSNEDTVLKKNYLKKIQAFTVRWQKADSVNKINLEKINELENRVGNASILNSELSDETNYKLTNFRKVFWKAEEKPIWNTSAADYQTGFFTVLKRSWLIGSQITDYYAANNRSPLIYTFLFAVALGIFFLNIKKKLLKKKSNPELLLTNASHIIRHPLASAALIITIFFPFFFEDIPGSYTIFLWSAIACLYLYIFLKKTPVKQRFNLFAILFFFFLFGILNFLIRSTLFERWLHIVLVISSIYFGYTIYTFTRSAQNYFPKNSIYIAVFFIVAMVVSLILNITGLFVVAKFLSGGAITGLWSALILYSAIDIIIEAIYITNEAYKEESKLVSYFDFFVIKRRVQRILNGIAVFVWCIILTRNINVYDYIYDGVKGFLVEEFTIGNFSFSLSSLLTFLIIIWVSTLISKLLLILFGSSSTAGTTRKNKWGSTVLLLRLGILITGILVGFAASGIPLDKFTIIVGALGVGIGFGLQNIVNNLVSGIILAFEKPIEVGDTIEINKHYGTVKEIGIRSSKLTTVEGSEVIVPNGDLLSQHIINWTLSNHFRRIEIIINVDYKSDLRMVEKILKDILAKQDIIEKTPEPMVLIHSFSESSVDFRLLFWCDIGLWISVKSELLMKIFDAFRENKISIPFPQRDIHIIQEGQQA